jgi:hypothetical protein
MWTLAAQHTTNNVFRCSHSICLPTADSAVDGMVLQAKAIQKPHFYNAVMPWISDMPDVLPHSIIGLYLPTSDHHPGLLHHSQHGACIRPVLTFPVVMET